MNRKKTLELTVKEWVGLLISTSVIMFLVVNVMPEDRPFFNKALLFSLSVAWIGVVIYCLLYGTRSVREQDTTEVALNLLGNYLDDKLHEIGYTDDCADEVQTIFGEAKDGLREWMRSYGYYS